MNTTPVLKSNESHETSPYGAKWPTPFSFAHSFVRYAGQKGMNIERIRWDIGDDGRGLAGYRVLLGGRPYSFIVASHMIDHSEQEDRIIATEWDATSALIDGDATLADFASVHDEVPNVLWGRATPNTLVWSRANRSVRLFEDTRDALASGKQPERDKLSAIGYLFRTTGFSANGRNGMVDYAALTETGHPLRGAYHAQMLVGYMWREFSVDLVEHLAKVLNPTAIPLAAAYHRYLGIGNSSGIGLAPFVVRHPVLLDHWTKRGEEALTTAQGLLLSSPISAGSKPLRELLKSGLEQAVLHFREQPTGTFEHFMPGNAIASDLRIAQRQLTSLHQPVAKVGDFLDALRYRISLESLEAVNSVVLEATVCGDEVDRLDQMTTDETLHYDGSAQCGALLRQLREGFPWALKETVASLTEDHYFWYYSEEHMEPRRGEPGEDPGEEYSIPLDVLGRLQILEAALDATDPYQPVAQLVLEQPDLHYMTSWVQTMVNRPNALIRSDFLARDFLPLDIMRFQLAIYGMLKMRPISRNWLRGTILQGAPLPDELVGGIMPIFPVAPVVSEAM